MLKLYKTYLNYNYYVIPLEKSFCQVYDSLRALQEDK